MCSLTPTWCPTNSPQLRLAFGSRKSSAVSSMQFQKLGCRIRLFAFAGDGTAHGSGDNRRLGGNPLLDSSSSADSLAADGGGLPKASPRNQPFGGTVRAGAARVVLIAGIIFIAYSVGSRSSSRQHNKMKYLTTQQETALVSDDGSHEVEESKTQAKKQIQNIGSPESKKELDDDLSGKENNVKIIGNDPNGQSTPDDADVVEKISDLREHLECGSAINCGPLASEVTQKPLEVKTHVASFAVSNFETSSGSSFDEDSDLKAMDSVSDDGRTNIGGQLPDKLSAFVGIESFYSSLDVSSNQSKPNSQPDEVQVSLVAHGEVVDASSLFTTNDLDNTEATKILDLENKKPSDVGIVSQDSSVGTDPMPPLGDTLAIEEDNYSYVDTRGTESISELTNFDNVIVPAGIPAPSSFADLQTHPGKVVVPAAVDHAQGQAFSALQALKVIEDDAQPGDLCTRREYARWLVLGSSALSRSPNFKVYPSMYIENVTKLAFDDITSEDPDYCSIQGLAEAGLISSKLSRCDKNSSLDGHAIPLYFSPESLLSRQDLVSWKMALEKRQLPVADRKILQRLSGFIDVDRIDQDAWPAIMADLSAGQQGIISFAFGNTRMFQPYKPVTKAQAAIALATGEASEIVGEELARIEAESMAEKAVDEHGALVAQVEKDVNANFEKELSLEKEKIAVIEKLLDEARQEMERLRAEREEENIALIKGRITVDSEMEILSKLRHEVENQLQNLVSGQAEVAYEKERFRKLRKDAEIQNQEIAQLKYELEVERKALSMARTWAEDEAKRAREHHARTELATRAHENDGIEVVASKDLAEAANAGATLLGREEDFSIDGTVSRAKNIVDKLKLMAADAVGRCRDTIHIIIEKILALVSKLKELAQRTGKQSEEVRDATVSKIGMSLQELQQNSVGYTSSVKEVVKRVAGDCREGVGRFTQKFKT